MRSKMSFALVDVRDIAPRLRNTLCGSGRYVGTDDVVMTSSPPRYPGAALIIGISYVGKHIAAICMQETKMRLLAAVALAVLLGSASAADSSRRLLETSKVWTGHDNSLDIYSILPKACPS